MFVKKINIVLNPLRLPVQSGMQAISAYWQIFEIEIPHLFMEWFDLTRVIYLPTTQIALYT